MIEIGVNKLKKNYGFKNILNEISFEIKTNEIVALVGQNGCGKSTLLKIIANKEVLTTGNVAIRNDATVGILNQIPEIENDETTVKDILYRSVKNVMEIKNNLTALEQKMADASGEKLDKVLKKYGRLQEEFINIGGYEINEKIGRIQTGFKIKNEMLDRIFNSLSGGEKTIVCFAALMIREPSILLLDEPTNHLDINTLEWLEKYLKSYNGTVLVVSHDRFFLDKISTKTILIENGKAEIFYGNYSYFIKENEKRLMLEFKDYNNQQKTILAMKAAIKKLKEWGKIGDNEQFFKRAANIEKRLEKMEKLDKPLNKKEIPLDFTGNPRSGKDVINVNNLNISFDKTIFKNASLDIKYGEHVCLIGRNGTGKSTLIKEILDNNNDSIKLGTNLIVGYIPQEIHFDDENITILEEAKKFYIGSEETLRSSLFKFLFYGENIYKKVGKISGGEKVRLKLFCLIQKKCNLLILDEPTNHIDIETREILEDSLKEYKGTLLFVSHDRYFINKLADRIISIENYVFVNYLGNYDYYKSKTNS